MDQSGYYLDRWEQYVSRFVRPLLRFPGVKRLLSQETTARLLSQFERFVPADRRVARDLCARMPDVVIASPVNMRFSEEIEYIKAANQVGIPTALPVHSWDNLTTKGLIHVLPDLLLAWNATQRDEAVEVHSIPPERIAITGAPLFDKWFVTASEPSDRRAFLRRVGLDADAPYLLYLGSSANITRDETWLVREIVAAFRSHDEPELRGMGVLVRPHPANARIYEHLRETQVAVWPKEGSLPESEASLRDFDDSLRHSVAVVGVNTTGMIDALVADRPVIAVLTERYAATQVRTVHFRHLLQAEVIEIARSSSDVPRQVLRVLDGQDARREARRRFVETFVRPRGLTRAAGELAACAIEALAQRRPTAEIDGILAAGAPEASAWALPPSIRDSRGESGPGTGPQAEAQDPLARTPFYAHAIGEARTSRATRD
jgi:hypothetical protein